MFSDREGDFNLWVKRVEKWISGVFFQNVRGALSFSVESQAVVIAAAVALGVLEFDEPSTEIDGQH